MRAVIAFLLLLAILGCRPPALRPHLPPAPTISLHSDVSPYATREGATVTLHPSGLQFSVPENWLEWHLEFGNNLHLTSSELNRVGHGAGEWDDEFARVCNATFPFDRCAAHVGSSGWGEHGFSFGDVQVRVYDLQTPLAAIIENIEQLDLDELGRIIDGAIGMRQGDNDSWRRFVYWYNRFYYDYGATAYVDIRLKEFDERTIAFVFMYTDRDSRGDREQVIADILGSVEMMRGEENDAIRN